MTSVAHGLVPVAGDAWRGNNTAARVVVKTPFTADDVVVKASIRGSDKAALTTKREQAVRMRKRAELEGRGW